MTRRHSTTSQPAAKTDRPVNYASGTDDPTTVIDMEGEKTFESKYPGDVSVAELQAAKLEEFEKLFRSNVEKGANATEERKRMEDAFRKLEVSELSLLGTLERMERLARKSETMGIVELVETAAALLLQSGVNGIPRAAQKMAAAVRVLKEENGIPVEMADPKAPLGEPPA